MSVSVHKITVNYRRYVDLADLELFLRRVRESNPHMTVDGYVKHVIKEMCER